MRSRVSWQKLLSICMVVLFVLINVPFTMATGTNKIRYTTIFYDDFNDNTKNTTLWTEVFTDGTWEERNQRVEFELIERSRYLREGIESIPFNVTFSSDKGLQVNWTIITSIGSNSRVGTVRLRVIDSSGDSWIDAYYWRWRDSFRYRDSVDNKDLIIEDDVPDGIWNNTLIIYGDRYRLIMGEADTGWINKTIFPEHAQVKVQIFITNAGSTPGLVQRSAFDDIVVSLIEEKVPSPIEVKWTYPSSDFFERKMYHPYEIRLNVSSTSLPNGKKNFTFGLDYNFTAYNLLGKEIQPEWELNEKSFCILSNSSYSQIYDFGTILNTTLISNETKEWNFTISNRWNWIEPWSLTRILGIVESIFSAGLKTYLKEMENALAVLDYEGYAEKASSFINGIWHMRYHYKGLGDFSPGSKGYVDVWVEPAKLGLLVESFLSAELASMATAAGFKALLVPFGWGIAAGLFAVEATSWVLSEISYAASVDPDYNIYSLATPRSFHVPLLEEIPEGTEKELAKNALKLVSIAEARKSAYAKFLGAEELREYKLAAIHHACFKSYTEMIKELLETIKSQLDTLISSLPPLTKDDIDAIKENLSLNGLPQFEREYLRWMGFTDGEIENLTSFYIRVNDSLYLDCFNLSQVMADLINATSITCSLTKAPAGIYIPIVNVAPQSIDYYSPPSNLYCYVEFPEISDLSTYKLEEIHLNGKIEPSFVSHAGDHDGNDISDFLVTFNMRDVLSLLVEGDQALYLDGNLSRDGNSRSFVGSFVLSLIGLPPVTEEKIGFPKYEGGRWITSSTKISFHASDDLSNVTATYYRIWYNGSWTRWMLYNGSFNLLGEGMYRIEFFSVDSAGNVENVHNVTHFVDNTPPHTSADIGKPFYKDERGEWITSNTSIYLNSTDYPECACGVKEIYYSYDDGTTWFVVNGSVASFYIPEECAHVVKWYAVDNLGNAEEIHERILNVDNIPPETTLVIEGHYSGSGTPDDPYRIAITPETRIYLNATDKPECGAVGVRNTYFRIRADGLITKWMSLKELEERGNDIKFAIPKSIIDKGGPFYLDYYSDDLLGNREGIKTAAFYFQKTL